MQGFIYFGYTITLGLELIKLQIRGETRVIYSHQLLRPKQIIFKDK